MELTPTPLFTRRLTRLGHLADIHISRFPTRHAEFRAVLGRLGVQLRAAHPDLVVLVGDVFHEKLSITNEAQRLIGEALRLLADIAPVVLVRGNHDYNELVPDRPDVLVTTLELMRDPRIHYPGTSGFFRIENLFFVNWHHGDGYSPWQQLSRPAAERPEGFQCEDLVIACRHHGCHPQKLREIGYQFVDLFHDPLGGARASNEQLFAEGAYLSPAELLGDIALLGDIHKRQFFHRPVDALSPLPILAEMSA